MSHHLRWIAVAALIAPDAQAQPAPQTQPLTLGDAARMAARSSGPAVAARIRVDQVRGRAMESRSALLPRVSVSYADGKRTFNTATLGLPLPGFNPNGQIIGPVRTVDARARVAANFLDPAAYGRMLVARASVSSAELEATQMAQQAAAFAGVVYVRAMRAEAQVRARSADSALAVELLGIAQRQLDVGVGVALDVTRARAQMAGIRAQLIAARSERDRAHLDLGRALGLEAGTSVVLRDTLGAESGDPVPAAAEAVSRAQSQRADLGAATASTETARRSVWAVRAERLPTIGVFGDDGLTSNGYANLLGTYTYGLQVSIPIFDGFRISAHARQASAQLKEAEVRQRDVALQVATDVRAALIEVAASREQVDAVREPAPWPHRRSAMPHNA